MPEFESAASRIAVPSKATVLSVAKLKLADLEKESSQKRAPIACCKERIEATLTTWPDLRQFDVRKLKPEVCKRWVRIPTVVAHPSRFISDSHFNPLTRGKKTPKGSE